MFEQFIFFLTIILISLFSYILSKKINDAFFPFNFWIFIFTVFHFDLFLDNYDPVIYYFIISLMITLFCGGYFGLIVASKLRSTFLSNIKVSKINIKLSNTFLLKLVWVSTLLPLIGTAYMIYMFGGIDGYVNASKKGNEVLSGFGFFLLLKSFIYPINIFYSAIIFKEGLFNKNKLSFFLHIFLVIFISILTLSRGTLLTHFLFLVLLYHYLVKKFTIFHLVFFSIFLILAASIYGVLREAIYFTDNGNVSFYMESEIIKTQWTYGGLFPISKILSAETFDKPLAFGKTYLAGITRFLPVNYFPNKLSGGGELFTEIYASNIYGKNTHFSGGLVAEAIVNFGFIGGILFSYIQIFLIGLTVMIFYKKIKLNIKINEFLLVFYCYFFWYLPLLIVGEFASFFYAFLIKSFLTTILFKLYYFKVSKIKLRA